RNRADEISDQPVHTARCVAQLVHMSSSPVSSFLPLMPPKVLPPDALPPKAGPGGGVPEGARPPWRSSRAARKPCWKLDSRDRIRSGETAGTGVTPLGADAVSAEPGTRLALGTRLGSPAAVEPSRTGSAAACAADQPSSALDDELQLPPRSNQADSTAA